MIREQFPLGENSCDVCIVGSGPVGIALALEFERLGCQVVMLESGGIRLNPELTLASRAEIVNSERHAPMEIAVCRAFGGTSWTWGGRCVAFDDIDFFARDYVPNSGWPIRHEDIQPWYAKAAEYLLCGDDVFHSVPRSICGLGVNVSADSLERWSSNPRLALSHRNKIEQSQLITLYLNSTVVGLDLGEGGLNVNTASIATKNGQATIKPRELILAGGGIETTRLLLTVQRKWPDHFGGKDGPLGRYYMGHISGKIASIVLDDPTTIADLDFELDKTGTYVRRRFLLSATAQRTHRLLNTAFFPDNLPFHDPRHRSGVLSAVFLALAVPPVGRRILPEPIRRFHVGSKPFHIGAHIKNVVLGAPGGIQDMSRIVRDRFLKTPRKPGFLVRNRYGRYALHYHAEQEPNPESRVVLTAEIDNFGLPRVSIDFRFTEADMKSVVASHELLDSTLRESSIGRIEYWTEKERLVDLVRSQSSDGFHQVGTTRMGTNRKSSVIDENLRVHGVANLHVASSSVFPTTGQANSTFVATALAIRLAHHLAVVSR